MDTPNNPPAFPSDVAYEHGMTLLDYFAGQALLALINNPNKSEYGRETLKRYPKYAYEFAQAMLAERSNHIK